MTAYRSPKYKKEKIQKETNCKTKKSNRQNEGGKKRWYAEALTKNKGEVQNECNQQTGCKTPNKADEAQTNHVKQEIKECRKIPHKGKKPLWSACKLKFKENTGNQIPYLTITIILKCI